MADPIQSDRPMRIENPTFLERMLSSGRYRAFVFTSHTGVWTGLKSMGKLFDVLGIWTEYRSSLLLVQANIGKVFAARLMFIGYGFNDDHLEQYLCPGFKVAKPSVILTKDLSENGRKVVANSKGVDVIAFCAVSSTDLR